jgi:hypothetical protein
LVVATAAVAVAAPAASSRRDDIAHLGEDTAQVNAAGLWRGRFAAIALKVSPKLVGILDGHIG